MQKTSAKKKTENEVITYDWKRVTSRRIFQSISSHRENLFLGVFKVADQAKHPKRFRYLFPEKSGADILCGKF